MISVRHVHMRYPIPRQLREVLRHPFARTTHFPALIDANIEIQRGDRIAFLGPNGAGKTTCLKLICGLLLPTEGDVIVNGHNTKTHNTQARKSVGLVMNEERSFFWRLTGRQNLEFFAALDNLYGPRLRKKMDELLELVGLSEAASKPVSNYSSGMKQKLAIARGLLCEPDVLILDEPTRTLDPIACEEFFDLILNRIHADSRKTLLIATHRLEEVPRTCNRLLLIHQGRVRCCEDLEALKARQVDLADFYRASIHQAGVPA